MLDQKELGRLGSRIITQQIRVEDWGSRGSAGSVYSFLFPSWHLF